MAEKILIVGIQIEIWAIIISFVAILIALLKDFILPFWKKPKLEFEYKEKVPFRKENIAIGNLKLKSASVVNEIKPLGTFLRMKVKNNGKNPAINCRCQIFNIVKESEVLNDYEGFPLKWASRPELILDQRNAERLSIGIGEQEFIDVAVAVNTDKKIHFEKYHSIPIGIPETLLPGKYELNLLFSGDNFRPYQISFKLQKKDNYNINEIYIKLIGVEQK